MSVYRSIERVEQALVEAIRSSTDADIEHQAGAVIAHLLADHPSLDGGFVRVRLNLSRVAADMERTLSSADEAVAYTHPGELDRVRRGLSGHMQPKGEQHNIPLFLDRKPRGAA